MNEQLQQALVDIINKAISGIDASIGFLSAEIPDVVHQVLMWYAVKGVIFCGIGVLLIVAWVVVDVKTFQWLKKADIDADVLFFGYGLFGSAIRLIPLKIFIDTVNLDWLKIWIAPKLWLIEYAASIVK